jgi:hypothetical protein
LDQLVHVGRKENNVISSRTLLPYGGQAGLPARCPNIDQDDPRRNERSELGVKKERSHHPSDGSSWIW